LQPLRDGHRKLAEALAHFPARRFSCSAEIGKFKLDTKVSADRRRGESMRANYPHEIL